MAIGIGVDGGLHLNFLLRCAVRSQDFLKSFLPHQGHEESFYYKCMLYVICINSTKTFV